MKPLILFALALVLCGGCTTIKPATPELPEEALEYRELQGEMQKQQEALAACRA